MHPVGDRNGNRAEDRDGRQCLLGDVAGGDNLAQRLDFLDNLLLLLHDVSM